MPQVKSSSDLAHLLPIKVTPVFDSYWRFAVERQNVFFHRLKGQPEPWTHDPVISLHKFTNAYRASDRVSQYLIRHVIYRDDLPDSPSEVLFRTLLFKLFNKIETWKLLEHTFGQITFKNYKFEHYDKVLSEAMTAGDESTLPPTSCRPAARPSDIKQSIRTICGCWSA